MEVSRSSRLGRWLSGQRGLLIGLGIGVVLTAGGMTLLSQTPARRSITPNQAANVTGQSVTVAPVQMTNVTRTIDATGSVAAYDLLPILPEATGLQIQQVLTDEGQTVRAGQVLVVLDQSVLQAQLNQAQAQRASAQAVVEQRQAALRQQTATLAEAQSNLRRYQQLASAGAISRQELETRTTTVATSQAALGASQAGVTSAQADVQSAIAQVQQLQTQLAQTTVRAPADGTIAERFARVGDVTSATGRLFTLIRNNALELQVRLPSTQLAQVKVGAPVRVTSDSDRRINLQGSVREIAPLVDPKTRQATVRVSLPSSPLLRSGQFLRAALTVQTTQAMTIPAKSVLPQTDGQSTVFVLQPDNTVRAQQIEIGTRQTGNDPNTARAEVIRGLNVGDRVVIAGAGYLKDGDRVTVVQ